MIPRIAIRRIPIDSDLLLSQPSPEAMVEEGCAPHSTLMQSIQDRKKLDRQVILNVVGARKAREEPQNLGGIPAYA
jgi:hypothetical protein